MHCTSRARVSFMTAMLMTFGCQESTPAKSEIVERLAAEQTALTSTTTSTSAPPIEQTVAETEIEGDSAPVPRPSVPSEPALESHQGLRIERLVTASEVRGREPAVVSSVFGNGEGKIYAFIEASNSSEEDRSLIVHFIGPGGQVSGGIELEVPASAPRWRTWAFTRHAKSPGIWHVEIRDGEGALVGVVPFEVEPEC
ncbi:MAG: DUF2914 domain-containing protein [Myxococcales bacterium]